jgi:Co/Zn/Cd efflux system component
MAVDVLGIVISAGVSATVSGVVGVIIKEAITRKLDEAKKVVEEQKKRRIEYEEMKRSWMSDVGRVLYHLVRWAQDRKQPNGDLDKAYDDLEKTESDMKSIERSYAAEAQVKE